MSSKVISGRYELLEKIGVGGMAVVYKAKDRLLNRAVAIKILKPEFTRDAKFIENFRRESHAAASLSHPNIVSIYDVGREGNINYIVMELVEGRTLSEVIREEAPLDYKRTIDISRQIATGLSAAHKHGIIHRDVKPHNILMGEDGIAKITDFGIAKAVSTTTIVDGTNETVMGSVHYFSPEQARGGYVDEKSDIYSLGIVMYEMLTGRVPFDGDNPVTVALMHINNEIKPPSELVPGIPPNLEKIVMKATDKYQSNRFKSADEVVSALDNLELVTRVVGDSVFAGAARPREDERDRYRREVEREPEREPYKEKKKSDGSKKKLIAIIIILAAVIAGGLIAAFALGIIGPKNIEIPDVRGYSYSEAADILAGKGLKAEKGDYVISKKYDVDTVAQQDPGQGSMARKNQTVTLNISRGAGNIAPNVVGMDKDKAESTIKKYGFTVGEIREAESSKDKDTVIKQNPGAGDELSQGDAIDLTVSDGSGKDKVSVPNLLGSTQDDAQAALEAAGLKLGAVSYGNSNDYGEGEVMSQQYSSGTKLQKGKTVDVKISRGGGSGSVNLYVDYSSASNSTFLLTITVADDSGTRSPVNGVKKRRSAGGESFDISGTGKGTITVSFDGSVIKLYTVNFATGKMS